MIDMKRLREVCYKYKDDYPGLDIDVKEIDIDTDDDYYYEFTGITLPIVRWHIEARLDAIIFGAYEYTMGGCSGCDTDEAIKRLTKDIMDFLSDEKVKHIVDQNRFERG